MSDSVCIHFDPLLLVSVWSLLMLAIIYYAYRSYPGSSTHIYVSDLGSKKSPKRNLFNVSFVIFGLTIIYLGFRINGYPGIERLWILYSYLMMLVGVMVSLVGIIHVDTRARWHEALGGLMFSTMAFSNLIGSTHVVGYFPTVISFTLVLIALFTAFIVIEGGWFYFIKGRRDWIITKQEWVVVILMIVYLTIFSLSLVLFS